MTVDNFTSVPSIFFYMLQIDMLLYSINFVFYNTFIEFFNY